MLLDKKDTFSKSGLSEKKNSFLSPINSKNSLFRKNSEEFLLRRPSSISAFSEDNAKGSYDHRAKATSPNNIENIISEQEFKIKEMQYVNNLNENIILELFKERNGNLTELPSSSRKTSHDSPLLNDKIDTSNWKESSIHSNDSNTLNIENDSLLKDIIIKKIAKIQFENSVILEKSESSEFSDDNSYEEQIVPIKGAKKESTRYLSDSEICEDYRYDQLERNENFKTQKDN